MEVAMIYLISGYLAVAMLYALWLMRSERRDYLGIFGAAMLWPLGFSLEMLIVCTGCLFWLALELWAQARDQQEG
jgi:hypothetical protein